LEDIDLRFLFFVHLQKLRSPGIRLYSAVSRRFHYTIICLKRPVHARFAFVEQALH
jgi:hypothetical protein